MMRVPCIHINDSFLPFTDYILNGEKTVETRRTNSLRSLVGKRVGIIRTGCGPATLVCFADIKSEIQYTNDFSVSDDWSRTKVPAWGQPYTFNKFGYELDNVKKIDPVEIGARGFKGNRSYRILEIDEEDA